MRYRIHNVLLVSSLYDSFILGEDGQLYEQLLNEYIGLNLSQTPGLNRVSSGKKALKMVKHSEIHYDLIITTLHLDDMHVLDFARKLRKDGIETPLVLLTYDNRELNSLIASHDVSCFDKVFMWQGNFNILLAIIKCIEDILNVKHDTELVGVQSIILVEDNVKFYSSYVPIIYSELLRQSQHVISEGVNLAHKILRMRARPKILLCDTYEEAWSYYKSYHGTILGVISDVQFPRKGKSDKKAGVTFARAVKKRHPDIPVLLQSFDPEREQDAHKIGASFLLKNSPTLLKQLRRYMKECFSFGDFIFKLPDGTIVDKAVDLRDLRYKLQSIPDESLLYHAERNHFSNWLKARTEFFLAYKLRPRKISDFNSTDGLRSALITFLEEYRVTQKRGAIVDFDPETFDPDDSFARIGSGSLGGKGRGLAFAGTLLYTYDMAEKFSKIKINVPPSVIITTDIFDEFLDENDLRDFAIDATDEAELEKRFLAADLSPKVVDWLRNILEKVHYPLAVRSSSLLEDSQFQPFAGVYETYMLPNNHVDIEVRLKQLIAAVKRVYASTFSNHAKAYLKATPYRLEEEKMAVIIQKLIGSRHKENFYPDFSGVLRSHNFYPIEPMKADDGITSVALGLGAMVVEGGTTVRFCPKYPRHLIQFSTINDALNHSQKEFYALEIPDTEVECIPDDRIDLSCLELSIAEKDNVLGPIGSTYSPENDAIYDGISRPGIRLVSFYGVLKSDLFPLSGILLHIMDLGRRGMSSPVEIEFSVNLSVPPGQPKEFYLLQMRPMALAYEEAELEIGEISESQIICRTDQVMGNGIVDDIRDIVVIVKEKYERSNSIEVARHVGQLNLELSKKKRPYLLIGVGRWGSADPWLGIPVTWDDISGAQVIIESGFKDMVVTPSQGTHFFQNLNAFKIGYFTVNSDRSDDIIDWEWLESQKAAKDMGMVRHIRLKKPILIKMNGRKNKGVVIKPEK
ncbi:MAG: histidine kinase [candidate division Zixibacteria bacterium]|nr:histidine kinase [candidate division Zixibacteria bacterium]